MRYNLLIGRKESQVIQQVCKLMERISVLEQEAATSKGTITSLQEQQSSVSKVIEEHVAEKQKVRHCACEGFVCTIIVFCVGRSKGSTVL